MPSFPLRLRCEPKLHSSVKEDILIHVEIGQSVACKGRAWHLV